jgi:hypothetical protein
LKIGLSWRNTATRKRFALKAGTHGGFADYAPRDTAERFSIHSLAGD